MPIPPSRIPPRALHLLRAAVDAGASYRQIGRSLGVSGERVCDIAHHAGIRSTLTGGRVKPTPEAAAAVAALVAECDRPTTCCPACQGSGVIPTKYP